jgi:hypothetical protein
MGGVAIEETEHQMAARLFQNVACTHLNACVLRDSRVGRRALCWGHAVPDLDAAALHAEAGS